MSAAALKAVLPCLSLTVWFCILLSVTSAQKKPEDDATIRLFYYPNTKNASERIDVNLANASSFQNEKLVKGKRAKIMVHGANSFCESENFPMLSIQAYLTAKASGKEDYNVFCLEYRELAKVPAPLGVYSTFTEQFEYVVNTVGNKTARFIMALESNGVVPELSQVHLIGHSLGGQVVGTTGRIVQEMNNYQRKVGRITGLDVMNIFLVYKNVLKLRNLIDSSDATFVDIIHTNDGQIGLQGDYGKVDFYPDGGHHQTSCTQTGPIENLIEMTTGACSHIIVGRYWAGSINNRTLTACKADSYEDFTDSGCISDNNVTFGEYVSLSAFGKFYLDHPLIPAPSIF
ncbi:unnamed protein product [Orchesella dallaii]|uniref:Lipase domain-containing protein n=1 Tax=Orchesella dallaii TaxID=48710 RepID=A0ABP1REY3_9HEXA